MTSAVATSVWTKRTIAPAVEAAEAEAAEAEAAAVEAAVVEAATATSDCDLRAGAGDPDRISGLGRSGQPKTNLAAM
jgi:hypothetical protein